ncbi:hypothetical protein DUNSADRAFT_12813 [Dunaliella salina]|uniref:Uncharacterized protein n=1 Tax=Dunaliella salina TaxID=3046 RepID=A0ABQ7GAJ6_DUNSA|nr:hypothetical protein DUNSADRAFT_12813 [Dunaliella salina]|eukprot:KAF5831622.1 hypothetical protein DUNSADRAFT_12813 [Dunaliella salina]
MASSLTTMPNSLVHELLMRRPLNGSSSGKTTSLASLAAKEEAFGVRQALDGRKRKPEEAVATEQIQQHRDKAARLQPTPALHPAYLTSPPTSAPALSFGLPGLTAAPTTLPVLTHLPTASQSLSQPAFTSAPAVVAAAPALPSAMLSQPPSGSHPAFPTYVPVTHAAAPSPSLSAPVSTPHNHLVASVLGSSAAKPAAASFTSPSPPSLPSSVQASAPAASKLPQQALPPPSNQLPAHLAALMASNPQLLAAYLQLQRQQQQHHQQHQPVSLQHYQQYLQQQHMSLQQLQHQQQHRQQQQQQQVPQQQVPQQQQLPQQQQTQAPQQPQQPQQQQQQQPSTSVPSPAASSKDANPLQSAGQGHTHGHAAGQSAEVKQEASPGSSRPVPAVPPSLRKKRTARRTKPGPVRLAQLFAALQPPEMSSSSAAGTPVAHLPVKNGVGRPRKNPVVAGAPRGTTLSAAAAPAMPQLPAWMQGLMKPEGQQLLNAMRPSDQQQQQQLQQQPRSQFQFQQQQQQQLQQHRRKKFTPSRAAV